MSSTIKDRARSLLAGFNWPNAVEALVIAGLTVQLARLFLAIVTPVGAYGDWKDKAAVIPPPAARQALFSSFDPFFRSAAQSGGGQVVTSLAIKVFGVRVNEASGLGSAIIAGADGVQNSFAVGDEIMPGVFLKSVEFDHITIDRGGAIESVFVDQSGDAPVANPGGNASPLGTPAPTTQLVPGGSQPLTAETLNRDVGFNPRFQNGQITGLVLTGKGPAFQLAGFRPGDIATQINGRPIGSVSDIESLRSLIVPGGRISIMVERGASVVPIALTLQGQ